MCRVTVRGGLFWVGKEEGELCRVTVGGLLWVGKVVVEMCRVTVRGPTLGG